MKKNPPHPLQRGTQYSLLALAVLAGCASHPGPPRQQEAQVQQFAGKGYLSEEQFSLSTTSHQWTVAGHDLNFIASVPVRPGKYPLVIYLPGLGESRVAGDAWRAAWAQAGYAVISIQLLAEDGQAWQSAAARNGDFKALLRERYGNTAMAARLAALRSLISELEKRGDEPWRQNVDTSRLVLAGYDLGAYTAQVAAGEQVRGVGGGALANLAGVIALSPYADFSGTGFDTRYAAIRAPFLAVTGPGDADGNGWVSPALRAAPFQHMPAGSKYLLSLDDASHDLFAGNALKAAEAETERGESRQASRSGRRGGMGGGPGGPGGEGNGSGSDGGRGGDSGAYLQPAIKAVTTAFLDSLVKDDDIAREWLRRDARRWLRDTGTLTVK